MPVFAHLEGICHVYVHGDAALDMAREIVTNAKMRRTGIAARRNAFGRQSVRGQPFGTDCGDLLDAGCEVRGVPKHAPPTAKYAPRRMMIGDRNFGPIIAVRVVDGLDEAMTHIARFGSNHTDAIITADAHAASRFLNEVDSAIVMHNCSTQFADGGEFGMEPRLALRRTFSCARTCGVGQLTSFKYAVRGDGQVRPNNDGTPPFRRA